MDKQSNGSGLSMIFTMREITSKKHLPTKTLKYKDEIVDAIKGVYIPSKRQFLVDRSGGSYFIKGSNLTGLKNILQYFKRIEWNKQSIDYVVIPVSAIIGSSIDDKE